MKHLVGVADMKIAQSPGDIIVTHALGSCLGITAHDPVANVGGMLHVMMPMSKLNPEKAKDVVRFRFEPVCLCISWHAPYRIGWTKHPRTSSNG